MPRINNYTKLGGLKCKMFIVNNFNLFLHLKMKD
jgi:hypothetical protein